MKQNNFSAPMTNKTFSVYTFGCRLNQAETQLIREKLLSAGLKEEKTEKAGWVIINSCAVTKKADKEVIRFIRRVKRRNPKSQLWLIGCLANRIKLTKEREKLPVERIISNEEKRRWLKKQPQKRSAFFPKGKGLVKIQEGCQNFCSYCIVPFVRGPSRSEPAKLIINQVKQLVKEEVEWIVLTGTDVVQYKDKNLDFLGLVEKILKETEIKLLGFGSISPLVAKDKGEERLLRLYKKFPHRLSRHLHLSLQSGSDRVLKLMGRKYSSRFYLKFAKLLKRKIAGLNLTTDIIVGFPGETEKEFKKTVDFVKKIGFGKIHLFRFSPRPGTRAARMAPLWGKISEEIKKQRAKKLAIIEKKMRLRFWRSLLGKQAKVLIYNSQEGQADNLVPVLISQANKTKANRLVRARFEKIDGLGRIWVKPLMDH